MAFFILWTPFHLFPNRACLHSQVDADVLRRVTELASRLFNPKIDFRPKVVSSEKRIRGLLDGKFIFDTTEAKLVWVCSYRLRFPTGTGMLLTYSAGAQVLSAVCVLRRDRFPHSIISQGSTLTSDPDIGYLRRTSHRRPLSRMTSPSPASRPQPLNSPPATRPLTRSSSPNPSTMNSQDSSRSTSRHSTSGSRR